MRDEAPEPGRWLVIIDLMRGRRTKARREKAPAAPSAFPADAPDGAW